MRLAKKNVRRLVFRAENDALIVFRRGESLLALDRVLDAPTSRTASTAPLSRAVQDTTIASGPQTGPSE